MADASTPKISVKLSLAPSTYSFSQPTPPELSLSITSDSDRPLTIFTWHNILWAKLALCQRRFVITDLATNEEVTQTSVRLSRMAFTRVRGDPDEVYYMTIMPHSATTISTPFGRGNAQPQPRAVTQRGWELDDDGKEMKIRRSKEAHGVDGLEPGHRYRLDVKHGELQGMQWRWGTKDDLLVAQDAQGADRMLSSVEWEQTPLEFEHIQGVEFSIEE